MRQYLQCGRFGFNFGRPAVMGVLNVTPDSFSDGGRFASLEAAIGRAEAMIEAGVDLIDIGGESSRPGAPAVSEGEELRRVMPVLYALQKCGKPLSIDTTKPGVMREAIIAEVDMINDINAFRAPGALEAVIDSDCALCIMHMQSTPQTMQEQPHYDDVVTEVGAYLRARVDAMLSFGILSERICIDPGFGFGKTLEHNLALLRAIGQLSAELGRPLLAGLSRKAMIGAITGKPVEQRLAGSLAGALAAVAHGANIVRVHDVAETVDALAVWQAAMTT